MLANLLLNYFKTELKEHPISLGYHRAATALLDNKWFGSNSPIIVLNL